EVVEKKYLSQWFLKITDYAEQLLSDIDKLKGWGDSVKTMQKNWIGKSIGASVFFDLVDSKPQKIEVFTTRPDTLFGVSFMVLCPEYEAMDSLVTSAQKTEVEAYIQWAKNRTERERQAEINKVSGVFTGSYAKNPFTQEKIPIWVSEYVLAGYGTGAIMAVPAHDSRDYRFAKYFNLPIRQVVEGGDITQEAFEAKEGILIHSDFLNGLSVKEAIAKMVKEIEARALGKAKVNFRLRDAIFSRQRYWGEPFPVYYKEGMPYMLDESELPLTLPEVKTYLPTSNGEPPLARAENWLSKAGYPLETNTMPGFAGSSAYYLRYMDPHNSDVYFSKEANAYWENVDLYIGGAEHATGHLIYARFWNKFLFDMGLVCQAEPFKKLINQGMIQGRSSFVYRLNPSKYIDYLSQHPQYAGLPSVGRENEEALKKTLIYVSKNIEGRAAFTDAVHVDIHL
ncbi:MAG: class I tRNA ligase family protein, partial [Bacteroidales bacterium]